MDQTYEERAVDLFNNQNANCAQAVLAVFTHETGLNQDTLLKIASPLGGGMARLGGMCGALSGACIAYGLVKGTPFWADKDDKEKYYEDVRAFVKQFETNMTATDCRDLLELVKDEAYMTRFESDGFNGGHPCTHIVIHAVGMVKRMLDS